MESDINTTKSENTKRLLNLKKSTTEIFVNLQILNTEIICDFPPFIK